MCSLCNAFECYTVVSAKGYLNFLATHIKPLVECVYQENTGTCDKWDFPWYTVRACTTSLYHAVDSQ